MSIADTDLDDNIKRAIAEQMQRVTASAASASKKWASVLEDQLAVLTEVQQQATEQGANVRVDLAAERVRQEQQRL